MPWYRIQYSMTGNISLLPFWHCSYKLPSNRWSLISCRALSTSKSRFAHSLCSLCMLPCISHTVLCTSLIILSCCWSNVIHSVSWKTLHSPSVASLSATSLLLSLATTHCCHSPVLLLPALSVLPSMTLFLALSTLLSQLRLVSLNIDIPLVNCNVAMPLSMNPTNDPTCPVLLFLITTWYLQPIRSSSALFTFNDIKGWWAQGCFLGWVILKVSARLALGMCHSWVVWS